GTQQMKAFIILSGNLVSLPGGPSDGGGYDLSTACPHCGTGARRLDPVKLPRSKLPKRPARTYTWQLILPPRLASAVKAVAPQCLRPVADHTGQSTEHAELIGEKTLPPWRSESNGWCFD